MREAKKPEVICWTERAINRQAGTVATQTLGQIEKVFTPEKLLLGGVAAYTGLSRCRCFGQSYIRVKHRRRVYLEETY